MFFYEDIVEKQKKPRSVRFKSTDLGICKFFIDRKENKNRVKF